MKRTKVVLLVLSILLCSGIAFADTINVPGDQPSIQAGIDIANDGDVVLVQPGTYMENVNFNGKAITIGSLLYTSQDTTYISQTIIDGSQDGSVVTFENGEDSASILIGFTITNGAADLGGGINCNYSSPSLKNLIIINNCASDTTWSSGGGIGCYYSSPTLENLKISDNIASFSGGGIYCSYSSPTLENVNISNNTTTSRGGGIFCRTSSPILENVTITDNYAESGGGIYCSYNSIPILQYVAILFNSANSDEYCAGGGIYCTGSSPFLEYVTVASNYSGKYGGGIYCVSSDPFLLNVTISNNSSDEEGGGIFCGGNSNPSVTNTIISDNTGIYGFYVIDGISNPIIRYTDLWNNDTGNYYGCNLGTGCIETNPLFVDAVNGDYHLTENSPCIDAGDPDSPLDPDGTVADMGAYYYDYSNYDLTFNSLSDMNTARLGFGYTTDGDYLYAVCGGTYEPPFYQVNNIERYDPNTDNWEVFVDGLIPRRYCKAEYLQSTNKIYIFGGQTYYISNPATYTDTVEVVDVANGDITYLTSNPNPYTSSGSAVWNNKIYIFGGSQNGVSSNSFYEFDPINNIWIQLPDMPESKQTEGEVVDGILYVFGGWNGSEQSNRIDAFNIQNNEWSFIGYMPFGISAHHTTVSGQYIWLIGDYDNLDFVAFYNTETHEFTQLNTNMIGRRHCGTEVIGNNLYVYGGNIATGGPALSSLQCANISYLSIDDDPNVIPSSIALFQNYPNPFNPETTISFSIQQNSKIELEIFNLKGQLVKSLINEQINAGNHSVVWNGKDDNVNNVSSGIYFYMLNVNGKTESVKKCILIK